MVHSGARQGRIRDMKLRLTSLLLLLAAAAAAPAFGAERWYQVEMIIFERESVDDGEVWPELPEMPDVSRARTLTSAGDSFRQLSASEMKLGGARSRLAAARGYKVLKHVGWRQPGLSRDRAIAVHLSEGPIRRAAMGGSPQPRLDGTVRLILSRYLHLEVDLALRGEGSAEAADTGTFVGAGPTIYRMIDSRRMRSGETHYLDHPKLGIIAVVTPL